jgi:crotonobetainyl-CoA:carnitine CoA-transferase CaiB-like acyl-CoA transferase
MDECGMAPQHLRDTDWDTWDDVFLSDLGDAAQAEIDRVENTLAAFFAHFTMREVYAQALQRRLLLAPVAHAQTIMDDPQLVAREFFVPVPHPALGGTLSFPGPFAHVTTAPLRTPRAAPQIGEHNGEILEHELGWSGEVLPLHAAAPTSPAPVAGPRPLLQRDEHPAPRPAPQRQKQPLQHVHVLDFTWYAAGPLGTKYLADHGAEVIKVETALRPDGLRQSPPWHGPYAELNTSQFFANYNTSKRSLALNLARVEARQLVQALVHEWADVVVESFTPGTMARWGLDYAALQRLRPNLIMLSTCMQGQTGPHAHYAGFGNTLAALSGFYHYTGYADSGPLPVYGAYTDFVACRFVGIMLLAALEHRRRTGKGHYIDLSQYEASLHLLTPTLLEYAANGRLTPRRGNASEYAAPHGIYRCQGDDRWCAIAITCEGEWQALCQVLGNPGWTRRWRFATLETRRQHMVELDRRVEAWTRSLPALTVMHLLQQAGIPAGVVQNGADLLHDPQLRHRGFFVPLEHPRMGRVSYEGHQFHLSESPGALWSPAPLLGQHTTEVLRDILRLPSATITRLREQGVLQ